jgi:anti-sigma factor RsiW
MKCSKAQELISPYIDEELSEGKKRELEDHIKACEKCRTEVEEMQGVSQLFVNTEKFKAPYGFHAKVMANVNASKTGRIFPVPILVRLAEAVMVLALIAVGIISGSFLAKGLMPEQAREALASSLHLDVFEPAPPDTLGGAYLAMTEVRNEK